MRRPVKSRLLLAAPVLMLALSGCSILNVNTPILPCPETKVLSDARNITRFRDGPGRDLSDIAFEGQIAKTFSSCKYSIAKDSGEGTLSVTMNVVFKALRGPAAKKKNVSFDYFVAITDTSQKVISRNAFRIDLTFPANITRLEREDDKIILDIPLGPEDDGSGFLIFSGFQISDEELKFNRANGQRLLR